MYLDTHLFTCSEQDKFVFLRHLRQELFKPRPGPDEHLVLLVLEHHREREAGVLQSLKGTMNESLVQIDDQRELRTRSSFERQGRIAGPHLRGERRQVLDEDEGVELLPLILVLVVVGGGRGVGRPGGGVARGVDQVGGQTRRVGHGQALGRRVHLQLLHCVRRDAGLLQGGEEGDGLLGAVGHPVLVQVGDSAAGVHLIALVTVVAVAGLDLHVHVIVETHLGEVGEVLGDTAVSGRHLTSGLTVSLREVVALQRFGVSRNLTCI